MASPAESEAKPAASAEERLAEAVRDLVRQELNKPAPAKEELPSFERVLWVGVILANIILLLTQVPDEILKDTSFEFASKLIGYVFGGLLLVYSSWAREQIMRLIQLRWFQACQLVLLIVLMFVRVHVFFLHPNLEPAGAQLFVDGGAVNVKRGGAVGLSFRSHEIKILPAADSANADTKPIPYQFTIGRLDLIRGILRNKDASQWTPLYMVILRSHFKDSTVVVKRYGGLFDGIVESQGPQGLSNVQFEKGELKFSNEGNPLATVFLPMGRYIIREITKTAGACEEMGVTVEDEVKRVPEFADQKCPAHP